MIRTVSRIMGIGVCLIGLNGCVTSGYINVGSSHTLLSNSGVHQSSSATDVSFNASDSAHLGGGQLLELQAL